MAIAQTNPPTLEISSAFLLIYNAERVPYCPLAQNYPNFTHFELSNLKILNKEGEPLTPLLLLDEFKHQFSYQGNCLSRLDVP